MQLKIATPASDCLRVTAGALHASSYTVVLKIRHCVLKLCANLVVKLNKVLIALPFRRCRVSYRAAIQHQKRDVRRFVRSPLSLPSVFPTKRFTKNRNTQTMKSKEKNELNTPPAVKSATAKSAHALSYCIDHSKLKSLQCMRDDSTGPK